jgi:hypothetical protein
MDESEFAREIGRAWTMLKDDLDLGRFYICRVSLPVDEEFRDVAFNEESTYSLIFRTGLSRSHYNILLQDYSYFQFSRASDSSWRLGYFPNPWVTGSRMAEQQLEEWERLEEEGILTHENVSDLLESMPYIGAVPPIRFEYALGAYREIAHPAAHFHIGRHTENRWVCSLALGPTVFALLVAKLYYPEAWSRCSSYYGAAAEGCIESKLFDHLRDTRLVRMFSERELQGLHFGRSQAVVAPTSDTGRSRRTGRLRQR